MKPDDWEVAGGGEAPPQADDGTPVKKTRKSTGKAKTKGGKKRSSTDPTNPDVPNSNS